MSESVSSGVVEAAMGTPSVGVHPGVSFAEYLAWDAVDCSLLKAMQHAPEMARFRMEQPEEDKLAYVKGRLFHLLATESGKASDEFVMRPETYADKKGNVKDWNGNANACKAQLAAWAAAGMTVVPKADHEDAYGMALSVRNHPKLGPLVRGGDVEVSVVWDDPQTGIRCKGRWDVYKPGGAVICDLKSTRNAGADAWFREAYRRNYHIQCAMYVDSLIAVVQPSDVSWFVFGVAENYPPYLVAAYDAHDDPAAESYAFLQYGRAVYHALLQRFKWCRDHDDWPGYGDEHRDMMLPPWVKDADLYEMR